MVKGLSDVRLKALLANPPEKRLELKDGIIDGLMLRVGPRGRPTWTFRFRIRGAGGRTNRGTQINGVRYHRVSLGSYPSVSIKAARAKAGLYAEAIERGENPVDALDEEAIDRRDTVASMIDDYVDYAAQTMRSWRNAKWTLNRHVRTRWGDMPAGTVTERDARTLVADVRKSGITDEGGKFLNGAAAEARKWGSMLFEWGRRSGRVKSNPFKDVSAPTLATRQRYLEMEEARAVWTASRQLADPWGPAIRLLMLTACRESEICSARWLWYDAKAATLLIPPESYKSNRNFLVPLPEAATAIIDSLHRLNGGDFMLSTTNGVKAVAGIARKTLDKLQMEAEKILGRPMKRFALHDFRRTVRTHLPRLGVTDVVAQLILGHAIKGLQARYNVYGYADEKRDALERWANELLGEGKPAGRTSFDVAQTSAEFEPNELESEVK